MTREERALKNLKQMCSDGRYLGSGSYAPLEVLEDFNLAIKALEQEPRKGHWISSNGVPYTYFNSFTICSECNKHPKEKSDFCPNCGAAMREVEE